MKYLKMKTNNLGFTNECDKDLALLENCENWEKANLKPNTEYACIMVEVPEGYELRPGKSPRYEPDGECCWFSGYRFVHGCSRNHGRNENALYCYKKTPKPEPSVTVNLADGTTMRFKLADGEVDNA